MLEERQQPPPVDRDGAARYAFCIREQSAYLEDEFASAEIKSGKQRVPCLLIVIVSVLVPLRVGGLRPLGIAHRPSSDSEFKDTLIADISVAGVPKPMPVVLEP